MQIRVTRVMAVAHAHKIHAHTIFTLRVRRAAPPRRCVEDSALCLRVSSHTHTRRANCRIPRCRTSLMMTNACTHAGHAHATPPVGCSAKLLKCNLHKFHFCVVHKRPDVLTSRTLIALCRVFACTIVCTHTRKHAHTQVI